jgi:hypothetical protein
MGLFGKLFGKKDDELGLRELDKSLNVPTGLNAGQGDGNLGLGQPPSGMPGSSSQYPNYQNPSPFDSSTISSPQFQSVQDQNAYAISKELEVISIKMDAIKMAIESLSQRLANLERAAYGNQDQAPQYTYPQQRYYRESPPRTY